MACSLFSFARRIGWRSCRAHSPGNKLLSVADLDSDTWVGEVKRLRGKKRPLTAAGVHALRDEYTRTIDPARALAAETLTLERTLSDLVNQAYALTPAEIALMWQTGRASHTNPASCNQMTWSSPSPPHPPAPWSLSRFSWLLGR